MEIVMNRGILESNGRQTLATVMATCLGVTLVGVFCVLGSGCTVAPPAGNSNGADNANVNANSDVDGGNDNGSGGAVDDNTGGVSVADIILAVRDEDRVLGGAGAPVTVVEYGDFQCPGCREFALNVFPTIKQRFVDVGDVRWVFRHFPLSSIHDFAEGAAQAAECAGDQGQFFAYHDSLFENQEALTRADLSTYAGELGLSTNEFDSCVDDSVMAGKVQGDLESGQLLGVRGTPTFFINGVPYSGSVTADAFSNAIESALAAATPGGDSIFDDDPFE